MDKIRLITTSDIYNYTLQHKCCVDVYEAVSYESIVEACVYGYNSQHKYIDGFGVDNAIEWICDTYDIVYADVYELQPCVVMIAKLISTAISMSGVSNQLTDLFDITTHSFYVVEEG